MGLFGLIGEVVVLPVRVAALPLTALEEALVGESADRSLKPLTDAERRLVRKIRKLMRELDR